MILLDTDIVTLLHSPPSLARDALVTRLEAAADAGEEIVVSIISFEEQMRGWLSFINRYRDPVKQVSGYERRGKPLRKPPCHVQAIQHDGSQNSGSCHVS